MDEAYRDLTLEDAIAAYEHAQENAELHAGSLKGSDVFWTQRAETFKQLKEELERKEA